MQDHFESKGILVNKENLKARVKKRRSIADLENAADKSAKKALEDSDSDNDNMVDDQ